MAPEVFKGKYDEKCDVWSIGIIMYLLLNEELPFEMPSQKKKFTQILKEFNFDNIIETKNISPDGKDLMKRLLQQDPKKRISAEDALKHPWFKLKDSDIPMKIDWKLLNNLQDFNVIFMVQNGR